MVKTVQKIIFIITLCFTIPLIAQINTIDSLNSLLKTNIHDTTRVMVLCELGREYIYISPDKTLANGYKAMELANNNNYILGKGHAYRTIAAGNMVLNNYMESNYLITNALQIFDSLDDKHGKGNCLISLGASYIQQKKFKEANEFHFQALKIFNDLALNERIAVCYNNISFAYRGEMKYKRSLMYLDSAYTIISSLHNEASLMPVYANYGMIYYQLGQVEKSTKYFKRVIELSEKFNAKSNTQAICRSLIQLAKIHKSTDENISIKYLKKVIKISTHNRFLNYTINSYLQLYKIYLKRKNIEKADFYIELYIKAKDSLLNQSLSQRTKAFEAIYKSKTSEHLIDELNKEKGTQTELISKQRFLLSLSLFLVIFTIIFIFYQFKHSKQRKKQSEKLLLSLAQLQIAKKEADAANLSKTQFLANMSHEIRSPLNAIVGFSQILSNETLKLNLPVNFKDMLSHIIKAGRNLSELINNILDLSKIESGKLEINLETINILQLIHGVYHINKESALKKDIKFNFNYSDNLPPYIISDRTKLHQILMNLVSNAIKFTSEKKSVLLDVSFNENELLIKVIDEGIGIAKDKVEKIFQSFEQADNTITRKFGGTGLGLAITKKIVLMMEGKIWVESELNKGSTFYVKIPIQLSNNDIILQKEWSTLDLNFSPDNVILIAEDIELNQAMLKSLFEELNLKVEFANNGIEAIQKTKDLDPDLVLMDIHMPEMDGIQATREIRKIQNFSNLPIVALSADAFIEQQNKALESTVTEYITKPIDFKKLVVVLQKYLKKNNSNIHNNKLSKEVYKGLKQMLEVPSLELKLLSDKIDEIKGLNGFEESPYIEIIERLENLIFSGATDEIKDNIKKEINSIENTN